MSFISGSRDVINGEEHTYDYDGYDGPGDSKRTRPKKNKTKKSQRCIMSFLFLSWPSSGMSMLLTSGMWQNCGLFYQEEWWWNFQHSDWEKEALCMLWVRIAIPGKLCWNSPNKNLKKLMCSLLQRGPRISRNLVVFVVWLLTWCESDVC